MTNSPSTLRSIFESREEALMKEISSYDKEYLRTVEISTLSEFLHKKYAVPEIQPLGVPQVSITALPGFDEKVLATEDQPHVMVTMEIRVKPDPMVGEILEATRGSIFSVAKKFSYNGENISLEAFVEESGLKSTIQHLRAEVEKRNYLIKVANDAFRSVPQRLLISARNHYFAPRRVAQTTGTDQPCGSSRMRCPEMPAA